jgi:hypothetical protein
LAGSYRHSAKNFASTSGLSLQVVRVSGGISLRFVVVCGVRMGSVRENMVSIGVNMHAAWSHQMVNKGLADSNTLVDANMVDHSRFLYSDMAVQSRVFVVDNHSRGLCVMDNNMRCSGFMVDNNMRCDRCNRFMVDCNMRFMVDYNMRYNRFMVDCNMMFMVDMDNWGNGLVDDDVVLWDVLPVNSLMFSASVVAGPALGHGNSIEVHVVNVSCWFNDHLGSFIMRGHNNIRTHGKSRMMIGSHWNVRGISVDGVSIGSSNQRFSDREDLVLRANNDMGVQVYIVGNYCSRVDLDMSSHVVCRISRVNCNIIRNMDVLWVVWINMNNWVYVICRNIYMLDKSWMSWWGTLNVILNVSCFKFGNWGSYDTTSSYFVMSSNVLVVKIWCSHMDLRNDIYFRRCDSILHDWNCCLNDVILDHFMGLVRLHNANCDLFWCCYCGCHVRSSNNGF